MSSWTDRTVTNNHQLPYVSSDTASDEVAAALRTLPFERNIFKLLANAPSLFPPFMKLLAGCWSEGRSLRSKEWQMIVLRTASLNDAPYEWDVNEPVARLFGWDEAHFKDIHAGAWDSESVPKWITPRLAVTGKAVDQLHRVGRLDDPTLAKAKELLGDQGVTELLIIQGIYALLARLMNSARIDFDPPIPGLSEMLAKYNGKAIARETELEEQDAAARLS